MFECQVCLRWAHSACAGVGHEVEQEQEIFIRPKNNNTYASYVRIGQSLCFVHL